MRTNQVTRNIPNIPNILHTRRILLALLPLAHQILQNRLKIDMSAKGKHTHETMVGEIP
jgi:hypothetical protein